jgi:hypothetical protein
LLVLHRWQLCTYAAVLHRSCTYAPLLCALAAAGCRLPEALAGPLSALRKAARQVGTAAADAKLGINVDEYVERFRCAAAHGQQQQQCTRQVHSCESADVEHGGVGSATLGFCHLLMLRGLHLMPSFTCSLPNMLVFCCTVAALCAAVAASAAALQA